MTVDLMEWKYYSWTCPGCQGNNVTHPDTDGVIKIGPCTHCGKESNAGRILK